MWAVVNFDEENAVEVVPYSWIIEKNNKCYWPRNLTKDQTAEAIKNLVDPQSDWVAYRMRILGKYDTFEKANKKASKAQNTDILTSTNDDEAVLKKRKRVKPPKYVSESSSEISSGTETKTKAKHNRESSGYNLRSSASSVTENEDTSLIKKPPRFPNIEKNQSVLTKKSGASQVSLDVNEINGSPSGSSTHSAPLMDMDGKNNRNSSGSLFKPTKKPTQLNVRKAFKRLVLRQLYSIQDRLDTQAKLLKKLGKKIDNNGQEILENDENVLIDITFPLSHSLQMEELEEFLKSDNNCTSLVKLLTRLGGSSVKVMTTRILYHVLTNEVAMEYSWEGQKGKKKFKELKLANVIFKAVRGNQRTQLAQDDEIIKYIKGFLVRAKERTKKKKEEVENNADADTRGEEGA
ncbi:unnamed protein product [Ceutorhynchus assimilis]|uniref:DUF4806 domain-containing protein n=1 Tax=Ceutorhynchus assimilis TaxID=467358 RepID=A0A9N9QS71_9CUCU|nr:unnamed protein product [Ceutorhynchus assimilis]